MRSNIIIFCALFALSLATVSCFAQKRGKFGPLVERVVRDASTMSQYAIDFETGELLTPPSGADLKAESKQVSDWLQETGADMIVETRDGAYGRLQGLLPLSGTFAMPLKNEDWGRITPDELRNFARLYQSGSSGTDFLTAGAADEKLPSTFGFRTREGGLGIMEITSFTQNPPGVAIGYRMILAPLAASETAAPATQLPVPSAAAAQASPEFAGVRQASPRLTSTQPASAEPAGMRSSSPAPAGAAGGVAPGAAAETFRIWIAASEDPEQAKRLKHALEAEGYRPVDIVRKNGRAVALVGSYPSQKAAAEELYALEAEKGYKAEGLIAGDREIIVTPAPRPAAKSSMAPASAASAATSEAAPNSASDRRTTAAASPSMSASSSAETAALIIESRPEGQNHSRYKEFSGNWMDSNRPPDKAKSSASGLTPQEKCGSRKVSLPVPVGQAAARFSPGFSAPGHYYVYVTWPRAGNATAVSFVTRHASGEAVKVLTQDGWGMTGENNADRWIPLGDFDFKAGSDQYVELRVGPDAKEVDTRNMGQAMSDAVRFSEKPLGD